MAAAPWLVGGVLSSSAGEEPRQTRGTGDRPIGLQRRKATVVATSWEEFARNDAIARVAVAAMPLDAVRRAHEAPRAVFLDLLDRGRREGAFRTDLTSDWLVTAVSALVHAAVQQVRAGELGQDQALHALTASILDLWTGPERRSASSGGASRSRRCSDVRAPL